MQFADPAFLGDLMLEGVNPAVESWIHLAEEHTTASIQVDLSFGVSLEALQERPLLVGTRALRMTDSAELPADGVALKPAFVFAFHDYDE